jgi:hypothetical protein
MGITALVRAFKDFVPSFFCRSTYFVSDTCGREGSSFEYAMLFETVIAL